MQAIFRRTTTGYYPPMLVEIWEGIYRQLSEERDRSAFARVCKLFWAIARPPQLLLTWEYFCRRQIGKYNYPQRAAIKALQRQNPLAIKIFIDANPSVLWSPRFAKAQHTLHWLLGKEEIHFATNRCTHSFYAEQFTLCWNSKQLKIAAKGKWGHFRSTYVLHANHIVMRQEAHSIVEKVDLFFNGGHSCQKAGLIVWKDVYPHQTQPPDTSLAVASLLTSQLRATVKYIAFNNCIKLLHSLPMEKGAESAPLRCRCNRYGWIQSIVSVNHSVTSKKVLEQPPKIRSENPQIEYVFWLMLISRKITCQAGRRNLRLITWDPSDLYPTDVQGVLRWAVVVTTVRQLSKELALVIQLKKERAVI